MLKIVLIVLKVFFFCFDLFAAGHEATLVLSCGLPVKAIGVSSLLTPLGGQFERFSLVLCMKDKDKHSNLPQCNFSCTFVYSCAIEAEEHH